MLPVGNHQKYDLVIEKDGRYYRIQCKHAMDREVGFIVRTKHEVRDGGKIRKEAYKESDCDFFMTEYKGEFYMFPVFGTIETLFWVVDTPRECCKVAKDYEALGVLQTL